MNRDPAVSVVMPVYNGQRYLRQAIESILAQSFTDFVLFIVDDGSTDDSLSIMRSYRDERIRVLAEPHRGFVATLNKGLAAAQGTYVARMDADDVSEPERLERQVAYLRAHPDVVMVGSWATIIDEDGNLVPEGWHLPRLWTTPTDTKELHVALCQSSPFVHGSAMMCREAVLAVGGYRAEFVTEDYDLWLRLSEVGLLANIALPLYRFRAHSGSKSAAHGHTLLWQSLVQAQRMALERQLRGRDHLGHARRNAGSGARRLHGTARAGMDLVTFADWARVLLRQGRLRTAYRLALWLLITRPYERHTWSVIRHCYLSRAGARAMMGALPRVLAAAR